MSAHVGAAMRRPEDAGCSLSGFWDGVLGDVRPQPEDLQETRPTTRLGGRTVAKKKATKKVAKKAVKKAAKKTAKKPAKKATRKKAAR